MNQLNLTKRREFIKMVGLFAVTASLREQPWAGVVVADVVPLSSATTTGTLEVRISDFPPLQQDNGSVRLGVNPVAGTFPSGEFYPVLINRASATQYYALSTNCSHQHCVVPTFNAALQYSQCPCHGSRYAIDGTVVRGPAPLPLTQYQLEFDGQDRLKIQIPGLGFSVTGTSVAPISGGAPRFKIDFPTFPQVQYEVKFRAKLGDAWTAVPFATTPSGAANQTSLAGNGNPASVFVDHSTGTGFYVVNIEAKQV